MKKFTFLSFLFIATGSVFGQVTQYSSSSALDAAFDGTISIEDFSGAPNQPSICGNTVSSNANDCFGSGELMVGFEISTLNEGPVVLLPPDFLPSQNTTPRLGANAGDDTTVITFSGTEGVYAVGHALHVDNNGDFNYKVFNDAGDLIFDIVLDHVPFYGVVSQQPISRIEISSVAGSGELIGDLHVGRQANMAIPHMSGLSLNYFPNPVTNLLNINSGEAIKSIKLYNVLGQVVIERTVNSTSFTIDLASVEKGAYIMTAESEGGKVSTDKIIKQ